jgi:biopolymer transport protein ExbD
MRPRWQRTTRREAQMVDVTAFLSLMVILVPFLLVTAVFSRTTIIELQSATGDGVQESLPDSLQLQVVVREDEFEVSYLGLAQPRRIDRSADEQALAALATLAGELKALHPESLEATVLLEPEIPYDLLVQVLDVLRIRQRQAGDSGDREARFPQIALGAVAEGGSGARAAP